MAVEISNRVLINVAPVCPGEGPYDPAQIAADVWDCARAGAAMVHLHVRDHLNRLTADLRLFRETVALIRQQTDIIIEASTGGVSGLTIQQRCAPLLCDEVEFASLNVGSVNLGKDVYINPIEDVHYCVQEIRRNKKTPEVEVFELGMIDTALRLGEQYGLPKPLLFSVVLGHEGAAPATAAALTAMQSMIPADAIWGITQARRRTDDLLAAAVGLGARSVRIGFEDSRCAADGGAAVSNAQLVEQTAKLLRALGKEPMTPEQARQMLGAARCAREESP